MKKKHYNKLYIENEFSHRIPHSFSISVSADINVNYEGYHRLDCENSFIYAWYTSIFDNKCSEPSTN